MDTKEMVEKANDWDPPRAYEVQALIENGRLVMIVAKSHDGKSVLDITEQLARKLHHARAAPPEKS